MRSVNKVILIGNLTRDPEIKQTPNGQSVVTFGLATNREWVTRDGRKNSLTEYHDLVAWANLAEICKKYLQKSKLVYVEGYLKTRSWDAPDGTKKFKTEIVVQDMIMLDKRPSDGDTQYIPREEHDNTSVEIPINNQATIEKIAPAATTSIAMEKNSSISKEKQSAQQPTVAIKSSPVTIDIDQDLGL